jgi:hypothetical protein
MFQPVPLLARVAAAADGMTIGTGVLLLTLLKPVECAENAASLDAIAEGRFVLGVGLGYRPTENAAFGLEGGRARLFERKLDVVRRLLAGESVTATGYVPGLHYLVGYGLTRGGRSSGGRAGHDGSALVHGPVALGDLVERQSRSKTLPGRSAGPAELDEVEEGSGAGGRATVQVVLGEQQFVAG